LDIPPGSIDVVWGDGILHHLRWVDYLVLSMPGIRRLGGSVVIHAKVQKPPA
jgi:hypothetical protein